jgi:2-polyprenyl-6-hydroxyphenyl methylase/3-demethylubiquinone-9 3-methyltransferase
MSIILKVTAEQLNSQYANGKWNYLEEVPVEKSRSAVIAMYCKHYFPEGHILDIGCGTGILFDFLNKEQQSNYMGIDLSEQAIQIAQKKRNVNCEACDAHLFIPARKFDIIVFNEALLYLDREKIFEKYLHYLNENGKLITSMVMVKNLKYKLKVGNIWKSASLFFNLTDELTISGTVYDQKLSWNVKVLSPISARQEK